MFQWELWEIPLKLRHFFNSGQFRKLLLSYLTLKGILLIPKTFSSAMFSVLHFLVLILIEIKFYLTVVSLMKFLKLLLGILHV